MSYGFMPSRLLPLVAALAIAGCSSDDASSGSTPDASAPLKDAGTSKDSAAPIKDTGVADTAAPGDDDDDDDAATPDDAASAADTSDGNTGPFTLTSPVLTDGDDVPADYTCATQSSQKTDGTGGDTSPAFTWTNPPSGTQSFAMVLHDNGNGNTHWVLYDIPASVHALPKGIAKTASPTTPAGAKQVKSYDNSYGYMGPCPGQQHEYTFTIYAMPDAATSGINAGDRAAAEATVKGAALGSAVIKVTSSDSKG